MSDEMAEALGMTSEAAARDADCEHFREVAMLAARVMQAEDEVDRLTEGIRDTVRRVAGLAAAAQRGEYGHPVAEVESLRAERDRGRERADRAEAWLDRIEEAAGFGTLAEVYDHQLSTGIDNRDGLRERRVAKIVEEVVAYQAFKGDAQTSAALLDSDGDSEPERVSIYDYHVDGCEFTTEDGWRCKPGCPTGDSEPEGDSTP